MIIGSVVSRFMRYALGGRSVDTAGFARAAAPVRGCAG
jgi:hypothetical protein